MQSQSIRGGEVSIEYTQKPLSGWGGMALFFEFMDAVGFSRVMEEVLPRKKASNNTVEDVDVVKTFFATILGGGNRFAHADRFCGDEVLRTVMGARRLGGPDTIRRLFQSVTPSESEQIYTTLQRFTSAMLSESVSEDVLDLDSTILERYGKQEGVSKGYHASRRGQTSHHPLLGMLARSKHIIHLWLRAGGASTLRGAIEFVDELMARRPRGLAIKAVRADAGFYSDEYLQAFEEKQLPYIIPARLHQPMKRFVASIAERQWQPLDGDHEVADVVEYRNPNWDSPRRVLFIRRLVRSDEKGRLFDVPLYEYSALVTTLPQPAPWCVNFYDQRGECENTIKEFKNDFGARGFCLQSFLATETAFRLAAVLFNLVTEFKRRVLRDVTSTLATIRARVFVLGAMLGRRARRVVLRLGISRWIERFETLLTRANSATSTAAQFARAASTLTLSPVT